MEFSEPLSPSEARRLARHLLEHGAIEYTKHALEQMAEDRINHLEAERSLRGICEPAEWEGEQWRYRFHVSDVWVVVAFEEDEDEQGESQFILVVTAWRRKRR